MALSDDQRALLRLLALREEGYEDIAALLGVSVEEVRSRVKETLAELNEPGAEAPRATPAPPPPTKPEPETRAEPPPPPPEPVAEAPPPRRGREEPRRRAAARGPARRRIPIRGNWRLVELAGGLFALLLLVLFATGAVDIGGGDSDSDQSSGSADAAGRRVTQAPLTPPGGGEAIGQAVFGRIGKGPVLQVQADGLEPTPSGKSYTVWLYRSPKLALRVGSVKSKSGGIAAQFPIPVELLSYVAGRAFNQISVSLTDDGAYKAEIARARKQKRLPAYAGETVLRGPIEGPLVRGARR